MAREAGVDIPTLCHDPRLEPYGACRLCLVEVEGARGPMAACGTKVSDGMKVQTHTDKIVKLRKFVLELLLTNHPLDCPGVRGGRRLPSAGLCVRVSGRHGPLGLAAARRRPIPAITPTWPISAPGASFAGAACVSVARSCPSAAGATSTAATTARSTRPTACLWKKWDASPAGSA